MKRFRYPAHFDTPNGVSDAKAIFNPLTFCCFFITFFFLLSIYYPDLRANIDPLQTRATVTDTSRSLAENLKLTGPALLSYPDVLQKTVGIVTSIITRKHPCQEDMALEEEADLSDIETTEFDWLVVDSAMDVISGMAVALGPSFAELWKIFEKQVLRYASSGESLERASACGVLAETITGMGEGVTPFTASMMQVLLKRLRDEDAQTKSNAAYAVGRLVEKSNDDATVTKAYPQILTALEPLFGIMEGRCRDNAAGCISRLILKHRNNVPVAEVLPALVQSGVLPLKEDYEENEPVWKMIVQLCKFFFLDHYAMWEMC
jgi:hypothetical protein